ncbi:MAG TPA: type II toxin-antitoxin system VapB family antitoxin [Desulfobaccales bacterium]|nr:type II toxin-antitoxin system VapB family antitoxin [Desulfobaccales bacterium]
MKTTIEISDTLLEAARQVSRREKTTVRSLVEEGLRKVIAEREGSRTFKLRKATFKGSGLQPQVAGASWDRIRDLIYEGRGA